MKYILAICLFSASVILLQAKSGDSVQAKSGYGGDSSSYGTSQGTVLPEPPPMHNTGENIVQNILNMVTALLPAFVLFFGIFIMVFIIRHSAKNKDFNPDHVIKVVSITLIVTGLLFVVSLAQGVGQPASLNVIYAPAFGLLGTLAGYMLGKGLLGEKKPGGDDGSQA